MEFGGASDGVETHRGRALKARDPGRRETPGSKVLKKRRSPRQRGRTGTSVGTGRACAPNVVARSHGWTFAGDPSLTTRIPPLPLPPPGGLTSPSTMLSTATLLAAHARTTGPPPALPSSPPPRLRTPRAAATATTDSMNAISVRVFPVPGGPCHVVSVRDSAAFTAARCDGFRDPTLVFDARRGFNPPGVAFFAPHGGGGDAMDSKSPPPSGMPISARCNGAYPVVDSRVPAVVFAKSGIPPASENATSAASARSCEIVFALRVVPYERLSGWSSKASGGVERRRGRGLKARDPGRRETPGKVLKERRSPRQRGRMGTSV